MRVLKLSSSELIFTSFFPVMKTFRGEQVTSVTSTFLECLYLRCYVELAPAIRVEERSLVAHSISEVKRGLNNLRQRPCILGAAASNFLNCYK